MKKTMKNLVPLILLMLIPYLNGSNVKAQNKEMKCEKMVLNEPRMCVSKAATGNIIVRNIIRK